MTGSPTCQRSTPLAHGHDGAGDLEARARRVAPGGGG